MSMTPEEYKRLASIASVYKPSQLVNKVDFYIKVLMFQHDCLMVDAIRGLEQDFEKFLGPLTSLMRDRQQLGIILELLYSIDTEYEMASPDAVRSFLDECKDEMEKNSSEYNRLRQKLQKLFDESPNADHL